MESTADSPTLTRSDENMRHVLLRKALSCALRPQTCSGATQHHELASILMEDHGVEISVPNKRAEPAKARLSVPRSVQQAPPREPPP